MFLFTGAEKRSESGKQVVQYMCQPCQSLCLCQSNSSMMIGEGEIQSICILASWRQIVTWKSSSCGGKWVCARRCSYQRSVDSYLCSDKDKYFVGHVMTFTNELPMLLMVVVASWQLWSRSYSNYNRVPLLSCCLNKIPGCGVGTIGTGGYHNAQWRGDTNIFTSII